MAPATSNPGPVARGAEAFKSGDYAAAAQAYSKALERAEGAEDRAVALANRAQCHLRLGDAGAGREDAAAARALDPANAKAWYRLGICEARLARLGEAEAALRSAAALRPQDAAVADALTAVLRRRAEADGKYSWPEIYKRYLSPGEDKKDDTAATALSSDPCFSVHAALGVEPFVGPVRVGFSEGRGRGLFVTEDVLAGQLLMCAQALVTGENDRLPERLADCIGRSAELRECVLLLSRGTVSSEASLPSLDVAQLVAPRRLLLEAGSGNGEPASALDTLTGELQTILYFNQFSLPRVNPNAAPIEVANDPARSGLWLLPSFANHSCRPNVQRVIVQDCLFLRAGRDLAAGDELFECYIETLQPLATRRAALASYGIASCSCERCMLEQAVLDPAEVRSVVDQAAQAKADPDAGGEAVAARAEAAATRAEILVARSLERSLADGRVPELRGLEVPQHHLTAQSMSMLREGFERCMDEREEESFERQERLHRLCLSSLANVVRGHAMSLRGLNRYVDQTVAWTRVVDLLEEVIPCSELAAAVGNEMLATKLLAFHLDFKKAGQAEFRRALLLCHRAYGGGAAVWRALNKQGFAATVLEGADALWAAMRRELGLPEDARTPEVAPRPVRTGATQAPRRAELGFEDLLRRRAQEERRSEAGSAAAREGRRSAEASGGAAAAASRSPAEGDGAAAPGAAGPASARERRSEEASGAGAAAGRPDIAGSSGAEVPGAAVPASIPEGAAGYRVAASGPEELTVVASLPGLVSAAEASLEVSEQEVRVMSARPEHPHDLRIPLPQLVDPRSSTAKWSKRTQQLTICLRIAHSEAPDICGAHRGG